MKDIKFFYTKKNIAIRRWMYFVPFLFIPLNEVLPSLFEPIYVEHVVQLITWIINILYFHFVVALIVKDNIEINRNKETDISIFYWAITISFFFFLLIWAPILSSPHRIVEVMSSFI